MSNAEKLNTTNPNLKKRSAHIVRPEMPAAASFGHASTDTQLFEASLLMRDGTLRNCVFSRMLSVGKTLSFTTPDGVRTFSPDDIDLIDMRLPSEITRVPTKTRPRQSELSLR